MGYKHQFTQVSVRRNKTGHVIDIKLEKLAKRSHMYRDEYLTDGEIKRYTFKALSADMTLVNVEEENERLS